MEAAAPATGQAKKKNEVWGWIRFVILLGLAYVVIINLGGLTRVSGHSMEPTLGNGDILVLNKVSMFFRGPHYGDVVVLEEKELGYDIVKRVIGVPGDRVAIREGTIYVNGQPLPELYTAGKSDDMAEVTVDAGMVFVVGDNREPGASLDSRDPSVGPIPMSYIKAFALVSLFPMHGIAKPLDL